MLGLVVLPFSAVYEIFSIWIFGKVWCSIWLAVDVWMCTASILHLVVISLDRYIAVTHPITYPNLMTSKKAKLLIAGAWIISFVVCFPPLVGWNDRSASSAMQEMLSNIIKGNFVNGTSGIYFSRRYSNEALNDSTLMDLPFHDNFFETSFVHSIHRNFFFNASSKLNNSKNTSHFRLQEDESSFEQVVQAAYEIQSILDRCQPKCTLTQEPGYVIYSAVGSFYAPMLVMMFLNWKIYRTALKTTKAIRQGWTKVKGVNGGGSNMGQGLGIHRGGGGGGIKAEKDNLQKTMSCKINNKKLQNQKTCPSLNTQAAGSNNNFLGVSTNANDRRLSLNVPLRSSATRQNRSRNSPIVPRQLLHEKDQIEKTNKENRSQNKEELSATMEKPVDIKEGEDTYEIKNITINSSNRCSINMNKKKEEPLQNSCVRINSLSSSKSHSSINVGNKDKITDNSHALEDYYKTHSMTSIPNERSLDHVMNHTNLLYSTQNTKRLKKQLTDTQDSVNGIDIVNSTEGKLVSNGLNHKELNRNEETKNTVLNPKSNHVPFNKFHYNRNHQCRHSRKTFSEQATQTDPKSTSNNEEEESSTKPLSNDISSQNNTNGTFGTNVNKIRLKSLFSKKSAIKETDEKLIAKNCNKNGPTISTAVQITPSFDRSNGLGCNSVAGKRKCRESIMQNPMNNDEIEHMLDNNSIDSKRAGESSKPYLCLNCHPRRWTRRKKKLMRCCWNDANNKKDAKTNMMMSFKRSNNSSSGANDLSDNTLIQSHVDDNGDMSPPNFHSSAEDDIHIYPLTGVAAMINQVVNQTVNITAAATGPQGVASKPSGRHFGKRNIKSQVRRFRMETKAAKTLGIIIGCFICCWFPFFTIYLTAAFCSDCIPELVFDVFFWLGYCNSALNPFIYAMFSREFRGAFKKIFYKLFCMTYEENVNAHSIVSTFNHRNMDINNTAQSSMIANSDHSKNANKL